MSTRGQYSPMGALFANHILQLGKENFADWLTQSFGGSSVAIQPGWFMYDEDLCFDEAMGLVTEEFEDDVVTVGLAAIKEAQNRLTQSTSPDGRRMLAELQDMFELEMPPFR